jgi:hypothetical protein
MVITRKSLGDFKADFNEAVKELGIKYGVSISVGAISYQANEFSTKITVQNKTINGVDSEQADFERYAPIFGFEAKDYKQILKIQGKNHYFIGFKLKGRKNTCRIREIGGEGKEYSCSENTVKASYV